MRWSTVGEGEEAGSLFDADALAERHVGRGEFRGMEFLHVNAKRIISEVPASSRMPFRYTINAYRGCSHACTYCLAGDTPILMADGQTRPLAEIGPGDVVYGTVVRGPYRRYEPTVVVDHWSTVKAAWRVSLSDGTELVASGDHRFLTRRGWKHVSGASQGAGRRPHLTLNDKLIGFGALRPACTTDSEYRQGYLCGLVRADANLRTYHHDRAGRMDGRVDHFRLARKRSITGTAIKSDTALGVVSIECLGIAMPMYDITTGTGDFIANGVVSHNCFARPTHDYLGLGIGEDFERKIVVKVNAVECLRAELAARRWAGHHIAMGTNTDPYQRCEGKYHLTQGVVRVLGEAANPFSILTKSTLILRDLDLLVAAARHTDVRVNLSIGTLDDEVWRLAEPGTPRPRARVEAVRKIRDAGIDCGVLVAPILPGLSDADEQIREVVEACVDAGATSISSVALHLRPGVREHYLGWLREVRPDLAEITDVKYRHAYLPKAEQHEISARVRAMVEAARRRRPASALFVGGTFADRVRAHMGGEEPRAKSESEPEETVEQLRLGW